MTTLTELRARHAALVAAGMTPRAALHQVENEIAAERLARIERVVLTNQTERAEVRRLREIVEAQS